MGSRGKGWITQVASSIPVDDSTLGYEADDVQEALEQTSVSASPGFSFGRSGNVTPNTWLQNEGVPSNKAGRWVYVYNAKVTRVFVANESVGSFTLEVFYHDGDEVNLTSVGTVTVTAATGNSFVVDWPVPTDKQLAIKNKSGQAKNLIAGLQLEGTSTP